MNFNDLKLSSLIFMTNLIKNLFLLQYSQCKLIMSFSYVLFNSIYFKKTWIGIFLKDSNEIQ